MDYEYQDNVAKVSWSDAEGRFELRILNNLKAYTDGETAEDQAEGKGELIRLAKDKGYIVIED